MPSPAPHYPQLDNVPSASPEPTKAIFVYSPLSAHPFAPLLHRRARHVTTFLLIGGHWLQATADGPRVAMRVFSPATFDLVAHFSKTRYIFDEINLPLRGYVSVLPFFVPTCTGLAKALTGVNAWWVQTPYQLHRWVQRHGKR